ncbi:MAG: hypothetical protein MUF31_17020 [Akkermansiaceae bacterium]|nr:hypothetical protein [Akkermansiaceae bacterium]
MLLLSSTRNGTRHGEAQRSRVGDPVPLLLRFLPLITAHCPQWRNDMEGLTQIQNLPQITSSSQHDRIELLPLNPDYDPIPIAPHEGPEMVVVGEWVASIDWTMHRNQKQILGILIPQVLWAFLTMPVS